MGASGKMDAKIPPVAGELSLRFRLRPAVRVLAFIQLSHHIGGEQLLSVHLERHVSDGGWQTGKAKVSFCRFVLVYSSGD